MQNNTFTHSLSPALPHHIIRLWTLKIEFRGFCNFDRFVGYVDGFGFTTHSEYNVQIDRLPGILWYFSPLEIWWIDSILIMWSIIFLSS